MTLAFDAVISLGPRFKIPARAASFERRRFRPLDDSAPDCDGLFAASGAMLRVTHQTGAQDPQPRDRAGATPVGLHNSFIEEMLADPMIQLVMKADGVTDAEIRRLYCVTPPAVRHQAWASDPVRE
ncbi:hypothetical protein LA6_003873 [Marinibacterium anthonyi]|nr:hypothetical protein LA6_003873 [Marinibacterium anthonyi]